MKVPDWARNVFRKVWPYIVLLMASLSHATSIGFHYGMLGSFTVAVGKHYKISVYQSSWIGAVHLATFLFMSPVACILSKVLPLWFTQIIGGVAVTIGVGLCSILPQSWHVVLSFGILGGCGMALVKVSSERILPHYFDKEEISFARACLLIGFSVGMTAFPLLLNYLFSTFGYRYTMITISKFMIIHIISGLTYGQRHVENKIRGIDYIKAKDRMMSKEILQPLALKLFLNVKVWAYLFATLLRKFGLTSFFILLTYYLTEDRILSANDVAHGRLTLGCSSAVGVVGVGVSHYLKYDRLIPHMIAPMFSGLAIYSITRVNNEVSFTMFMGMFGVSYGIYIANILGAVVRILNGGEEISMLILVGMVVEGVGALCGAPTISYIQEVLGLATGMYFAAAFSIMSGLCIMIIFISESTHSLHEKAIRKDNYLDIDTYSPPATEYRTILQQSGSESVRAAGDEAQPLISSDDETTPLNGQSAPTCALNSQSAPTCALNGQSAPTCESQ